jgi:glutaredoxin 3
MMSSMSEQRDNMPAAGEFPADVEVYSTPLCSYCARALRLLRDKGARTRTINVAFNSRRQAEMMERARGSHTVPQIFINGAHIGGSDELAALERAGKLDVLLAASS